MNEGILAAFDSHDFLRGMSQQHRLILASGVRPFAKTAAEYLAKEGESANSFFLIQEGTVELEMRRPDHGQLNIHTVGAGEIVGWSWIVPPHRWQFDCKAKTDVSGLLFDAAWLREKIEQDHELGYHILKKLVDVISKRLSETRSSLTALIR